MRLALQLLSRILHLIRSMDIRTGVGAVMFAGALLVNLLQSEDMRAQRYKAFPRHHLADITRIAEESSGSLKASYGLFFELGRQYPGSTIVLPHYSRFGAEFQRKLLSYGRASQAAVAPYKETAFLSDREYEALAYGRKSHPSGDWVIITADFGPKVFLVLRRQRKTILLDLSLLSQWRNTSHD